MSDIRKIQTGNNQYTLHARVSDKLAVNAQIGSTTKPVYVDSSGQVQACTNNMAVSETIAHNTDLNTYKTPGFYNAGGSSSLTNTPTSNSDGLGLLVIHDANGQFYTQIAFPHTGGVYRRNCSNDVWENWVKIEDFTTTYKTKLDGIAAGANKTIVDTAISGTSTNPVQNKAVVEALKAKADTSALNNYLTKIDAGNTYAKKSDISAVYKYKGSVNKVSGLPNPSNLTASNAGDVYNVGTASSGTNITVKSGDNVAWVWDSTTKSGHWDNLSGTVDLSNYLQKGGKQTTTSTADGGNNIYTFTDGSTITVKNGSKGSTGAAATWFSGTVVNGTTSGDIAGNVSGSKAGDMYLNTGNGNVYRARNTNTWVYVCNIKGSPGANGTNGKDGATGATVIWHTGTAISKAGIYTIANAKIGDMYLNTTTCDVFRASSQQQAALNWMHVCNIKGAKGDATDIPKLGVGVAGIVPGPIAPPESNPKRNKYMWLNAGSAGAGVWQALPTIVYDGAGQGKVAKSYTQSVAISTIQGRGTASTKPTIQKITEGANDYRAVESDASGLLFVNVPAYEKNANTAQNTVLAAPTSGAGTATFRKLTTSDIPWGDKLKVVTESKFNSTTPTAGVFYFVLEE